MSDYSAPLGNDLHFVLEDNYIAPSGNEISFVFIDGNPIPLSVVSSLQKCNSITKVNTIFVNHSKNINTADFDIFNEKKLDSVINKNELIFNKSIHKKTDSIKNYSDSDYETVRTFTDRFIKNRNSVYYGSSPPTSVRILSIIKNCSFSNYNLNKKIKLFPAESVNNTNQNTNRLFRKEFISNLISIYFTSSENIPRILKIIENKMNTSLSVKYQNVGRMIEILNSTNINLTRRIALAYWTKNFRSTKMRIFPKPGNIDIDIKLLDENDNDIITSISNEGIYYECDLVFDNSDIKKLIIYSKNEDIGYGFRIIDIQFRMPSGSFESFLDNSIWTLDPTANINSQWNNESWQVCDGGDNSLVSILNNNCKHVIDKPTSSISYTGTGVFDTDCLDDIFGNSGCSIKYYIFTEQIPSRYKLTIDSNCNSSRINISETKLDDNLDTIIGTIDILKNSSEFLEFETDSGNMYVISIICLDGPSLNNFNIQIENITDSEPIGSESSSSGSIEDSGSSSSEQSSGSVSEESSSGIISEESSGSSEISDSGSSSEESSGSVSEESSSGSTGITITYPHVATGYYSSDDYNYEEGYATIRASEIIETGRDEIVNITGGMCWIDDNDGSTPIIEQNNCEISSDIQGEIGFFDSTLDNVLPGHTYNYRAWAMNSEKRAYGALYSFTLPTEEDICMERGNYWSNILSECFDNPEERCQAENKYWSEMLGECFDNPEERCQAENKYWSEMLGECFDSQEERCSAEGGVWNDDTGECIK